MFPQRKVTSNSGNPLSGLPMISNHRRCRQHHPPRRRCAALSKWRHGATGSNGISVATRSLSWVVVPSPCAVLALVPEADMQGWTARVDSRGPSQSHDALESIMREALSQCLSTCGAATTRAACHTSAIHRQNEH